MGCDIHGPWIEYRAYKPGSVNGEVWYNVAEMDGTRDYRAFGLMAGVRFRAEPVVETFRGRPIGMDVPVRVHVNRNDDCHSANWLTLDEMRVVADAYRLPTPDLDHPDDPIPDDIGSWWSFVDLCIALMGEVERRTGAPTRAVFCFDN